MEKTKSIFETLNAVNVNDKVDKKEGLSYLSWADAWAEVKRTYPSATYQILRDPATQSPYFFDQNLGYMVMTSVTIEGETLEMWLPVMDSKNKAMKFTSYTYATRYGDKTVEAASMFDINKTLMRCLTKNLAMFGLGLYIYAKEDMPEGVQDKAEVVGKPKLNKKVDSEKKEAPTETLPTLKPGTPEFDKVESYAKTNATLGRDKVMKQIERKYKLSALAEKMIDKIFE